MVETETYTIHPAAFIDQPVATPHQSFLSTGSEVPFDKKSSFPPGEAKGKKPQAIHNQRTTLSRKLRVARLATPTVTMRNQKRIPFIEPPSCVSFGAVL